jgi:hypothetical protein
MLHVAIEDMKLLGKSFNRSLNFMVTFSLVFVFMKDILSTRFISSKIHLVLYLIRSQLFNAEKTLVRVAQLNKAEKRLSLLRLMPSPSRRNIHALHLSGILIIPKNRSQAISWASRRFLKLITLKVSMTLLEISIITI